MSLNPFPSLAGQRVLLVCPENLQGLETELAGALARSGAELTVAVRDADTAGVPPRGTRLLAWQRLAGLRRAAWPTLMVYASPPSPRLHLKIWWWKRRRVPRALLGGCWRPIGGRGAAGRFALASFDFFLAGDQAVAAALRANGVFEGRVQRVDDVTAVPAFLARRLAAEERCVLWVEEDISLQSPSAKHLVYSIPHLQAQGWEIRQWCLTHDAAAEAGGEVVRLRPVPRRLKLFQPYWFFAVANWHGIKRTVIEGRPPARIVHTMGGAFLGADIASIHFVNAIWLRKQRDLGIAGLKGWLVLLWTALATVKDQLQFSNPRCRLLLPVSDSIGEEVRRRCLPRTEVRTLANSYDESRFNPEVRARWREPMRRELGYAEADCVFCFASQGHHQRKGFWLAVEALARLRRAGEKIADRRVRFLVIGGTAATIAGLKAKMTQTYPDWQEWISFTGTQSQIERYLSAADAFLFPSYFEAFCLAEIEIGALGLPLLLTSHPGTEMILREGQNGLRLSFDPAEIAATLKKFVEEGLPPFVASAGRALDRASYGQALAALYAEAASGQET